MQIAQELKKRHSAQRKLRICKTYAICETCELFCATPTSANTVHPSKYNGAYNQVIDF